MTFAEADAQYEVVKQQYLSGALADEQFDEQLRRLMVLDAAGAWWAKSRENGVWHYFDAATGNWVAATPPTAPAPPPPPPPRTRETGPTPAKATGPTPSPAAAPGAASTAHQGSTSSAASDAAQGSTSGAAGGEASLPKWAAVKPGAPTPTAGAPRAISGPAAGASGAPGAATRSTASLPGTAQGAPATGGYHPRDFGPIAELTGSMKVLFYVLSLFLPFLGLILYFVYRHKPAEADRAAARVFLILGIASLVFTFMCGATFFLLESPLLGAGTWP